MTNFQWMPVIFWLATFLTLLPAGLAITSTNRKSLILSNMFTQLGVFLLIISLGVGFPAVIFLVLVFPLNIMMLYGHNLFPETNKQSARESRPAIFLKTAVCFLLFLLLIIAFYQNHLKNMLVIDNSGKILEGVIPDVSLLLILIGILIMLILVAISHFLRRK